MDDKKLNTGENLPDDVAKDIVKRKRKDLSWEGNENLNPGDNARYIRHSRTLLSLKPINLDNEVEVAERIDWYFTHCEDNDMKPTVTGMANALGIDRRTLFDWGRGKYRGVTHSPIIKRAYAVLEELWEDYMLNGKINPVSGIFLGKNHFGYTDKQEIVIEPKNPLGDAESPDIIKQRYIEEHND